jgi:hypothetical protein
MMEDSVLSVNRVDSLLSVNMLLCLMLRHRGRVQGKSKG